MVKGWQWVTSGPRLAMGRLAMGRLAMGTYGSKVGNLSLVIQAKGCWMKNKEGGIWHHGFVYHAKTLRLCMPGILGETKRCAKVRLSSLCFDFQ